MKPQWFHGYYWLILLALLLYVPFILFGGFGTSDDLSLVAHVGSDYWQDLKYSFSRSGHVSHPYMALYKLPHFTYLVQVICFIIFFAYYYGQLLFILPILFLKSH